jgi:hypothetical protein
MGLAPAIRLTAMATEMSAMKTPFVEIAGLSHEAFPVRQQVG